MKVLISGASGLLGRRLRAALEANGDQVVPLQRGAAPGGVSWDSNTGEVTDGTLEGFDAVVHLAGENIAAGRWTADKKMRIRDSRVDPTRRLAGNLTALTHPPKVFLCASAVGFYGNRESETIDENSAAGEGFLPTVCREWEAATEPANRAGIRVVNARFGAILDPKGGALGKILPPFRAGLGGRLGDGHQWMSWVSVHDAVAAVRHALEHAELSGPVNVVSPHPVTNAEFTATLARVLHRPAVMKIPGAALRALAGEMADAVLLASARVRPEALLVTGFRFEFPELEAALRSLLKA